MNGYGIDAADGGSPGQPHNPASEQTAPGHISILSPHDGAKAAPAWRNLWPRQGPAQGGPTTRNERHFSAPTVPVHAQSRVPVVFSPPYGAAHKHSRSGTDQEELDAPLSIAGAGPALRQQDPAGDAHLSAPSTPGMAPVFSQRRRRSSWAGSSTISGTAQEAGLEALSPDDLYRQFVAIRDAVLRKAAAGGKGGGAAGSGEGGNEGAGSGSGGSRGVSQQGEDGLTAQDGGDAGGLAVHDPHNGAVAGLPSNGGPSSSGAVVAPERSGSEAGEHSSSGGLAGRDGHHPRVARRRGSDTASTPSAHSPHRLSNATYADPRLDGLDPAAAAPHLASAQLSPRATTPVGSPPMTAAHQHFPSSAHSPLSSPLRHGATASPVIIDLQQFYRSPTPSTGGCSPFQDAVSYASDCVAYNALYTGAPPTSARSPSGAAADACAAEGHAPGSHAPAEGEAAHHQLATAGGVGEAGGSIPATDSLFSLQPSFACATNEGSWQNQQQHEQPDEQAGCRGSAGGAAARMLVWQEDMTASTGQDPVAGGEGVCGGGGEVRLSGNGSGVVVHCNGPLARSDAHGGDSTAQGGASDYQRALQSAAAGQLLIPLPSLAIEGPDAGGAPGKGAAGRVPNSDTAGPISGVFERERVAEEDPASSPFKSYVPLPLPGLPPPGDQATTGAPGTPPGAATSPGPAKTPRLPSSPSMVAAATEAVRKCLDKGIPFAAMTAEHFAAVVAAAEAQDSPLALHILTTHCTYYPGAGRHAASAGGAALDASAGGASNSGAGSPPVSGGGSGGGGLLGRRPATAAAAAAAAAVRKLLESGESLHVMSPCEYQRIALAAQYGVRQLHDMLVAQPMAPPSPPAASAAVAGSGAAATPAVAAGLEMPSPRGTSTAVAAIGRLPVLMPLSGSTGRRHRRGSSIGSEGSFTAAVVRFQSGTNNTATEPLAASPRPGGVRTEPAASAPAIPATAPAPLQGPERLRALVQAAQHGNVARVAYLVARGADVNATEGPVQQQQQRPLALQAPESPTAGGSSGGGGGSGGVLGRTALHYAAEAGSFAVVQLLIHYGAFVGVRDSAGRTACDLARRKGHEAVAQLLKDAAERRRDVVRSCAAESRGGGGGGASAALAALGLTSRVSPAKGPSSKELSGSGPVSGGSSRGPVAAKEGGAAAQAVPVAAESRTPAMSQSTNASSAEVRQPAAPVSARSVGAESGTSGPGLPLSRFSKEASAAAATAAAAAAPPALQPTAPVATAAAAVAAPSEIVPASKGGSSGGEKVEPARVEPPADAQERKGERRGGKRGLLACFVCGA